MQALPMDHQTDAATLSSHPPLPSLGTQWVQQGPSSLLPGLVLAASGHLGTSMKTDEVRRRRRLRARPHYYPVTIYY